MPSTSDDVAALRAELHALSDRAEIAQLCDRYARHLDHGRESDSWLDTVFTDDVVLTFPMGAYKGMDGLAEFQRMARTTFERTHHISSNYSIVLDGDQAQVHAHLLAVHVRRRAEPSEHFMLGGHYQAQTVRTPRGWRIQRFTFDLVWTAGAPPKALARS
jgi:hypothetical protein